GALAHRPRRPRAAREDGLELLGRPGDVHPLLVLRLRALALPVPARVPLLTTMTRTVHRLLLAPAVALVAAALPAASALAQGWALGGTAFTPADPVPRAF